MISNYAAHQELKVSASAALQSSKARRPAKLGMKVPDQERRDKKPELSKKRRSVEHMLWQPRNKAVGMTGQEVFVCCKRTIKVIAASWTSSVIEESVVEDVHKKVRLQSKLLKQSI